MKPALLIAALAVILLPCTAAAFDPAEGDPDALGIDFADADASARVLVYRRDVERAAGTDPGPTAEVIAAELDEGAFPAFEAPFGAGLEQTAWTPHMAEALAVALEAGRAGDPDWGLGLMPIWGRLNAFDDVPAWAARCRWALIGGPRDPTPCEKLAAVHLVARGGLDPAVTRLRTFADVIAGRSVAPGGPGPAPLEPAHRVLTNGDGVRSALAAWDRQIDAGLTPVDAAAVLRRWSNGLSELSELSPPLAADAGAWPLAMAEGAVLRVHLGRLSSQVAALYGHQPRGHIGTFRTEPAAAFEGLAVWHRIDPMPGGPADFPALAARCRDARIRAAGGEAVSIGTCLELADLLVLAAGPLDPRAATLRLAAAGIVESAGESSAAAAIRRVARGRLGHDALGRRALSALVDLARPAPDDGPTFLELEVYELAGFAANWDAEVAVGTALPIIPALLEKYSEVDLYGVAPYLLEPSPDGGAWRPSMADGVVVAVVAGQLRGDAAMGIGGLAAWRAALVGPGDGSAPLEIRTDLPALTAACRTRLLRFQLGHAPPEPAPCEALADALEWGEGTLHAGALAARSRALMMARSPVERRRIQTDFDRPWVEPEARETRRARDRLMALADVDATLYREDFVEYFNVDTAELIDAWERDLAAGLIAEHAAEAVADRARQWVSTISTAITPPFPADAGAWPAMMAEALTTLVAIGRVTGRAELVFPLLPALDRIHDAARPDADVPALSATCRMAQIEAMDGRPPADIDACLRLYALYQAGLGPLHPWLTAERLRLAALYAARGERAEADGWLVEALASWSDPPTVDATAEAVWALSEALWARGASLRALARPRDAVEALEEGRLLAAAVGYARVGDGLRFLADEAEAASEAGDLKLAAQRLLAITEELGAAKARIEGADDDLPEGYQQARALGLASARAALKMSIAFGELPHPRAAETALSTLDMAWSQLVAHELGDYPLAVEVLARRARRRVRGEDPGGVGRTEAREAVTLQARLDSREQPWLPLIAAAEAAHAAGELDVAIAWAKGAVDATQAARLDIGALGAAAEQRFVEARIDVYSTLADWLIEAGRLVEADEVQGLSRRLELSFLTRSSAPVAEGSLSRSGPEKTWARRFAGAVDRLRAGRLDGAGFGRAVADAERRLDETTGGRIGPDDAAAGDVLPERLGRLGRTALLQVVLTPDRTRLVLSTPAERVSLSRDVGRAVMNARAYAFYRAVRGGAPMATVDAHGQALYADLIAPIADRLDAAGISTLMVAPDGALRYVPFAALRAPDGRFAVERRAIVRYPVLSPELLDGPSGRSPCITAGAGGGARADCIAAFGAREPGGGLSVLNFVPAELEGIVRRGLTDLDGRIAGAVHLDAAFTAEALRGALVRGTPVVHVASHFVFHPGSASQSFLALGAGARLDLQRLAGPAFPFDGVELLTLSACETAVGTFAAGQPPDSLSALALRKGARAVLASLWPVADDSTATLMRAFYGELAAGQSKAEALRRAQLALLGGPAPSGRARKFGLPGARVESGAHPYAWAPFVLVGDWR